MTTQHLTHLKQLEAEGIHIIREVAAEFEKPVMLHLAMKAFYPGKSPFPLLHVDTIWKSREMIEFRDRYTGHACTMLESASATASGVDLSAAPMQSIDALANAIRNAGLLCLCPDKQPSMADITFDCDLCSIDEIYGALKNRGVIHG